MPKEKSLAEKADAGELDEAEVRAEIDDLKAKAFELEQLTSRIRAAKDRKYNEALAKTENKSSREVPSGVR